MPMSEYEHGYIYECGNCLILLNFFHKVYKAQIVLQISCKNSCQSIFTCTFIDGDTEIRNKRIK